MRIPCPFCGPRDAAEFSYLGDASVRRPDSSVPGDGLDAAMQVYVYIRDNPAGPLKEYWYHGAGCHSWLVVDRDTRTHEITGAAEAHSGAVS
ncbi:MAG: sarcosine oxidase subunit delta [Xanthobacteraceae bacterium]|nr:sarcosine oxidase subunit delta [Xanthobacteraceae bacterium]